MQQDCVVVSASFAGLACAAALAGSGARVTVLDLAKIAPLFRFGVPAAVRAGLIPCGGIVERVAAPRVLLVGDAAGMVSPVTAGGIHMALKHGLATGHAIADFLSGRGEDPARDVRASYPTFRAKRVLRFLFDHFQSDLAFNLLAGHASDAARRQPHLFPPARRVRRAAAAQRGVARRAATSRRRGCAR